jgi:hypothetical protein
MYLSVNNALSTNSIFLKKGELSFAKVGNAAAVVVVDLDLGTLSKSTDSVNDYSIESFSNDWYRISIYNKLNSNFQMHFFAGVDSTGANVSTNGTDGIYIFGAQLEQQSYATNLMLPTTEGSTVTRLKDEASRTGLSDYINSEEGTLFVEAAALSDDSTNRNITLSDGTDTNRFVLKFDNQSNIIQAFNRVAGAETAFLGSAVGDITLFNKIAVKYKANDFALWINGVEVDTDLSGASFPSSTLSVLSFSQSDTFYSKVNQLQVYKTALSDAELTTLTTI